MTKELFFEEIQKQITDAKKSGLKEVVLKSGDIHRVVGGYPGESHRMPVCCDVMREIIKLYPGSVELNAPLKGKGATLKIRYVLYTNEDIKKYYDSINPLSKALFDKRLEKGWTIQDTARYLGINTSKYDAFEEGVQLLNLKELTKIANFLDIEVKKAYNMYINKS